MQIRGPKEKLESQYVQGTCILCKKNKQQSKGVCKKGKSIGKTRYKNKCTKCSNKDNLEKKIKKRFKNECRKRPWIHYKKDYCEECGFIPVNPCQLDVDHIDGNRKNNNPSNYKTLCANCHRLKTHINKDAVPHMYK